MSFFGLDLLPELDPVAAMFGLPVWMAGAVAAVFAAVFVLAVTRSGTGGLIRYAAVLIGALTAFAFVDRSVTGDRIAERRALEGRASELVQRAVNPGSALACLDGVAGEVVENECEKAIFASPEATAAALSYVGARLTLLADAAHHAHGSDPAFERILAPLRRAVELDRFGLHAQILSLRDGCTPEACDAFALLGDTSRIVATLKGRTFDAYVDRHSGAWSARNGTPAVATASPPPVTIPPVAATPSASAAPGAGTTSLNFPSAASIPAVSIMNAEPPAPPPAGSSAAINEPAASGARRPPTAAPAPARRPPAQLVPLPPPPASNGASPQNQ
jgi:hypothetical protein